MWHLYESQDADGMDARQNDLSLAEVRVLWCHLKVY